MSRKIGPRLKAKLKKIFNAYYLRRERGNTKANRVTRGKLFTRRL